MVITEHKKGRAEKEQTGFHEGQKVALLISDRTQMGFIAVINGTHKGILYKKRLINLEKDDIRLREGEEKGTEEKKVRKISRKYVHIKSA